MVSAIEHQPRERHTPQRVVLGPAPFPPLPLSRILTQHRPVQLVEHHQRFAIGARHLLGNLPPPPVVAVVKRKVLRRPGILPADFGRRQRPVVDAHLVIVGPGCNAQPEIRPRLGQAHARALGQQLPVLIERAHPAVEGKHELLPPVIRHSPRRRHVQGVGLVGAHVNIAVSRRLEPKRAPARAQLLAARAQSPEKGCRPHPERHREPGRLPGQRHGQGSIVGNPQRPAPVVPLRGPPGTARRQHAIPPGPGPVPGLRAAGFAQRQQQPAR